MTAIAPYIEADSDTLYEVTDGVTVEKTMSLLSLEVASVLDQILGPYSREHNLGRVLVEGMFEMPPSSNIRRPDVAFVSYAQWPKTRRLPNSLALPLAPGLAVEVISPSDKISDVLAKIVEYFRGGVRIVWLVDPIQEQVFAHTPAGVRHFSRSDTLDAEPVVPGFRLPLTTLFPAYDPEPTP